MAAAGLIDESCQLATEALHVGRDYGSERVTARVRDLDDALAALYGTETPRPEWPSADTVGLRRPSDW
jgi:hypothetical protein